MSWKSITKSIAKPFKKVGREINWTGIREPLIGTAVGGVAGGLVGLAVHNWTDVREPVVGAVSGAVAGGAMGGPWGALAGAVMGATAGAAGHEQVQQVKEQARIQEETAAREAQLAQAAMLSPTEAATQDTAMVDAFTEQNEATRRRRAFGLSRTTISGSVLGGASTL